MRIAAVVAVFVVLFAAGLVALPTMPASGQTVPPTATATPDFPYATPRPTVDGTPEPTATSNPNCPPEGCNPVPTPRPTLNVPATPDPGCVEPCFPFPTPRPTFEPGAPIEPAQPDPGPGIWFYSFMPKVGKH